MSDDLPPVDGHIAATVESEQSRPSQVRQKLMEALARERLILEQWRHQAPSVFDFGAATRDLWELWRAEVGELRAPPPRPTPRNYQDAADAFDLFQRAVDALPDLTLPADSTATPLPSLTDEDRYILTVLEAHRGKSLTYRTITQVSVRMEREDRTQVRRLSDSTIRTRVPVLLTHQFVARPPGTAKKGIAITDKGSQALAFARGNATETQRKK
jgi:hypothetical protein